MQSCCFGFGSTEAVGQSFGSFSPRGARSKGGQQPDGRVAHNQKLSILGVDTNSRYPCSTRKELVNETHTREMYTHNIRPP